MSLVWPILVVVAAAGIAVGVMLLVRRRAPEGSYFADGDRASGVFGVIATGFSVLLGFIIFLAFTSYDNTKQGAETEALVVAQQFETAQFMPAAQRQELSDGLVCYARYVVHRAWPRLEAGTEGDRFNPWGVSMFRTLQQVKPNGPTEEAAFSKWLDQSSERTAARQDRIHAAQGVVPTPLWIVLFLTAARDRRVHALLRRQRRAGEDAGAADRLRRLGGRRDAAPALVPRQPVLRRRRQPRSRSR